MISILNEYIKNHQISMKQSRDGIYQYYGIPYPIMRDMAKSIIKSNPKTIFEELDPTIYEHLILYTMVLRGVKDISIGLTLFDRFLSFAKDWSTVDSLCQNFVVTKEHLEVVWNFLIPLLKVDNEFVQRVVAVMVLTYFINDQYIDRLFEVLDQLTHQGYYTKMGVAWAVATIASKYPSKVIDYLHKGSLDIWTHNKAIQKAKESFRVEDSVKEKLHLLKR